MATNIKRFHKDVQISNQTVSRQEENRIYVYQQHLNTKTQTHSQTHTKRHTHTQTHTHTLIITHSVDMRKAILLSELNLASKFPEIKTIETQLLVSEFRTLVMSKIYNVKNTELDCQIKDK